MDTIDTSLLLRDLGIDVLAIIVLSVFIYYRRYRRRDNAVAFIAFNIALFTVASALTSTTKVNIGVGFGLFGVLSVVRLRSDEATQSESGYTMVAIAIGLLNGLPGMATDVKILFSGILVAAMYIFDHPVLFRNHPYQRLRVELDTVITDESALRSEIENRVGGTLVQLTILDVDFVRETMRLDVRVKQ